MRNKTAIFLDSGSTSNYVALNFYSNEFYTINKFTQAITCWNAISGGGLYTGNMLIFQSGELVAPTEKISQFLAPIQVLIE
jgi:hypothetical protein